MTDEDQICFYLLYRLVYNIFLHPLRHCPGPWYRAASRLPYTISIFQGTATFQVAALHEKYGQVVRVSPDTLSYTTAKAWPDKAPYQPSITLHRHRLISDPDIYGHRQSNGRGDLPKDPKSYLKFTDVAEIVNLTRYIPLLSLH